MLDCLVLGDSLAAGVGGARPACQTVARVGITSGTFVRDLLPSAPHRAAAAVISLGVNDDPSMATIDNLRALRAALDVGGAVWLLPGLKDHVRAVVRTVAAEWGDRLVDTRPFVGADHLHPSRAGYAAVALETTAPGETEVAFDPGPAVDRKRPRHARARRRHGVPMHAASARPLVKASSTRAPRHQSPHTPSPRAPSHRQG